MPPTIEISRHAMLRYVQRVDPGACVSEVEHRVRDSYNAGGWVYKGLLKFRQGKYAPAIRDGRKPLIARRDRRNHCVFLLRVESAEKWALVTVLSQRQVQSFREATP